MKKWFSWLDGASLAALIVAMCGQINLHTVGHDTLKEGLGYATKTYAVSLSDVTFLGVVLWFFFRTLQTKSWERLWWPPLPCFALIFALVLSALHSGTIMGSIAQGVAEHGLKPHALLTKESKGALFEIIQWTAYFGIAPWVFVNLLHDRREVTTGDEFVSRRQLAIRTLFCAVVFSALAALSQLGRIDGATKFLATITQLDHPEKLAPSGLFGSPNVYGAFLAIVLPLLLETETEDAAAQFRFWIVSLGLVMITLVTVASLWAFIATGIGLTMAVFARSGGTKIRAFRLAIVAGLALTLLCIWRFQPAMRPYREVFTSVGDEEVKVKKQYVEWQAAIGWNVPRSRAFATGVGPGNYQFNIGDLYASLPNEKKMPPDSNNLYLVQAVSIGILGLGALLWTVGHFWSTAWRAARTRPTDWLGAGVVGALSSWFFVNAFHALIVRGAGLVLAFLFALSVIALEGERNDAAPPKV